MKYMGSKARIVKHILPIILKGRLPGQWYIEPFCGGLNSMANVVGSPNLGSDIDMYLIDMWRALIGGNWLPEKISREDYYKIKASPQDYPSHLVGWVAYNCSYSGKVWGGFAGSVKTKEGLRDYQQEAINNIAKQLPNLQSVMLECKSYEQLHLPASSLVYCDPPYANSTGYSGVFDHLKFWNWVRETTKAGHSVFISEYQAPEDFECIWSGSVKSSLSANGIAGSSKTSIEKLYKYAG